jgi:hypothetical protein
MCLLGGALPQLAAQLEASVAFMGFQ